MGMPQSDGQDTSLASGSFHSDEEYTGPVLREPPFKRRETSVLNSRISQSDRGGPSYAPRAGKEAGQSTTLAEITPPSLSGPHHLTQAVSSTRIFGFVAKSQTESQENVCHLFAEYDTVQPASQVISLVGALLQDTERM